MTTSRMLQFGGLCVAASLTLSPTIFASDAYVDVPPSRDGIGKVYMDREIAHVMGHEGAPWLERASRVQEEGTDKLVPLLGLRSTDAVADIGAGTGYFSFRMSQAVPQGKVYAEDVQTEMLAIIKQRQAKGDGANIVTVLGDITDPKLPASSVDLMLLVDAYHEFSFPREMGEGMVRALKPGGRIALVEYRGEDPEVPIKELHKMTEVQAKKEMTALGLTWEHTDETLPWQHLMFFKKPGKPLPPPYTAPNPTEISVFFESGRYVFRTDDTLSIYAYDKDSPGKSNCAATCAKTWRPVAAPATARTVGDWTAIKRADKTKQWTYKGKPVYNYVYDLPGQIKGDGVDGLWHVVNP